jgi:hypothetical protein
MKMAVLGLSLCLLLVGVRLEQLERRLDTPALRLDVLEERMSELTADVIDVEVDSQLLKVYFDGLKTSVDGVMLK